MRSLGRNYVIAVEAVNAQSGDIMAREQVEVGGKRGGARVARPRARRGLREKLGESLTSIQKFDVPLPRATTPSLEALHAYALALDQGRLVARAGGGSTPQTGHRARSGFRAGPRALVGRVRQHRALDARAGVFAPRRSSCATASASASGSSSRGATTTTRVQDWDKALELARTWTATYPREAFAFSSLAVAQNAFGEHEQAIESLRTASRLDPSFVAPVEILAATFMALDRYDDAREAARRAVALRSDLLSAHRLAFQVAFVARDAAAMAREVDAARRLPDGVAAGDWVARAAAFDGRVRETGDLLRGAVRAAAADIHETAAQWSAADAEIHAAVAQCPEAREAANVALERSRDNFTLERAGRALALCGIASDVSKLSAELTQRFPDATFTRQLQLPVMAAALALQRGDAKGALAILEPVKPYDWARGAEFWPGYLRGLAYLATNQGADAVRQFQAIAGRRGEAPDSILFPLARLGLARAWALTADREKARASYDAFLDAWREADPDLLPLKEARIELARLR